jgi:hypothetical protein
VAGRDEVNLPGVVAVCGLALQHITLPEGSAERTEFCRRLDEVGLALATVRTRLEVGAVLSRAPIATCGLGTSPMASEAAERLLRAMVKLLAVNSSAVSARARNVRAINVRAQRDT